MESCKPDVPSSPEQSAAVVSNETLGESACLSAQQQQSPGTGPVLCADEGDSECDVWDDITVDQDDQQPDELGIHEENIQFVEEQR